MATHSSILVWRIPWIEEPGGVHSIVLQRVSCNLARTHNLSPHLKAVQIKVTSGLKRLYKVGCWERLKAGEEGDDRNGWMASLTQWI